MNPHKNKPFKSININPVWHGLTIYFYVILLKHLHETFEMR